MIARDSTLFLKSSPPHVSKGFVARKRLSWTRVGATAEQVVALIAPTGFGKTSQLLEWRREASAEGAVSLWYSLDKQDQPLRLVRGLTESGLANCSTFGFSDDVVQAIRNASEWREALTTWLAEIAFISADIFLVLDDAHRLPAASLSKVMPYLLGNAPANLRVVLSAQPSGAVQASGLLRPGLVAKYNATDLRFRLDETQSVLMSVLGEDSKPDDAVRLHELTEGWPLGIQLCAAALRRGGYPDDTIENANADLRRYFVDTVIESQAEECVHMLTCLSHLNLIHPDLCNHIFGNKDADKQLQRLINETPLFLTNETQDWVKLHPFARKILKERLAEFDDDALKNLSKKASEWYALKNMFEEAAEHAFLVGDSDLALDLLERSTQNMTEEGRSSVVIDWYDRMTREQLQQHPRIWPPIAWALAMSHRHEEAEPLVKLILNQPELSEKAKFEASLIRNTASSFGDRLDLLELEVQKWDEIPKDTKFSHPAIFIVANAAAELYKGEPEKARALLAKAKQQDDTNVSPVTYGFAEQIEGFSYLWGGQFILAEQVLRSGFMRAEERLGRRHPMTCMLAALLARACWDLGNNDEAALLLADRMTILERSGLPETLLTAYKVKARLADLEGRQDRALTLLDSLQAIGRRRGLIRLSAGALSELAKLHARHSRAEISRTVVDQLARLVEDARLTQPEFVIPWFELHYEMSAAGLNLIVDTSESNRVAKTHSQNAIELADRLKRGGDFVESHLLLAEALERTESRPRESILNDAFSLAKANGMKRLMDEHETLSSLRPRVFEPRLRPTLPAEKPEKAVKINDSALLTPKEREVLVLLSKNFSNKEIAQAMNIGIETVKWHIKNLSGKLHAGNRKHAVARARMLGLFVD